MLQSQCNTVAPLPPAWRSSCSPLLQKQPQPSPLPQVIIHASQCNRRNDTFDGIDVCGQRLADEMRAVVAQHPSLERISVVGHSMGAQLLALQP